MTFRQLMHARFVTLVGMLVAGTVGNAASAALIAPGQDFLQTLAGGAVVDLTPAGLGLVPLEGLPIGPGQTDTIITRTGGLPDDGIGVIPAELTALSLISVDPVNFDSGTGVKPHHVFVTKNPIATSPGTVTVLSHNDLADPPSAGTFDSSFALDVNVFVRADDNSSSVGPINILDTLDSSGAPWSHVPPPDYPNPELAGGFFPGAIVHEGPHPVTFPAVRSGEPSPDGLLPPLCDPAVAEEGYQIVEEAHARWKDDITQMIIDLTPPSRHCPLRVIERGIFVDPVHGLSEFEVFDSLLEGTVRLTDFQGNVIAEDVPIQLQGPVQTLVFGKGQDETAGAFETEILSMDLQGTLPMPDGSRVPVQIMQDQRRPSQGRTVVSSVRDVTGKETWEIDSFFDVFTELQIGTQPPIQQEEAAHMRLGLPRVAGDTDKDRDVDVPDLLRHIGNFSGPQPEPPTQQDIINKYPQDGDNDGDRDVDIPDILLAIGNFTGPQGGKAGHTIDHATHADLIYDPANGNVKLDPADDPAGKISGFVLKNAAGGSDFSAPGTATFPAGGLSTDLAVEISWADPFGGFSSTHDLGNVFPTGFDLTGLEAFLTAADYTGALGAGVGVLDLFVIPEPGSMTLLGMGAVCLLGFWWRRKHAA